MDTVFLNGSRVFSKDISWSINQYIFVQGLYNYFQSNLIYFVKRNQKKSGLASKQCKMKMHMQHQFTLCLGKSWFHDFGYWAACSVVNTLKSVLIKLTRTIWYLKYLMNSKYSRTEFIDLHLINTEWEVSCFGLRVDTILLKYYEHIVLDCTNFDRMQTCFSAKSLTKIISVHVVL